MGQIIRGGLVVVGILLMLAGLGADRRGAGHRRVRPGSSSSRSGAFLVVVVAIERQRYRSDAAERTNAAAGPGGGEPAGALEPRFRPTAEVFIDPTTATGCASSSTRRPASGGTSPRADHRAPRAAPRAVDRLLTGRR